MLVEQDFRWFAMSMTCLFDYLFPSEDGKSFAVRQDLRWGRPILLQKCALAECIWVYNDSMQFGQIYLPNSKSGERGFGHIPFVLEIHLEDVTTCWGNFQILPPCEVPAIVSGCSQWSGGRPWTWQPSGSRVVHTAGKKTRRGGLVLVVGK